MADFPPHPSLTPPLRANHLKFFDETYPTKTRGMVLLRGENCMHNPSFNRFCMIHPSDRQTDRRTDRRI